MLPGQREDVLYFIVCGERQAPAAEAPAFVRLAQAAGLGVCVIATPAATRFISPSELAELTAHPVRRATSCRMRPMCFRRPLPSW
jgi:hypothetical protein